MIEKIIKSSRLLKQNAINCLKLGILHFSVRHIQGPKKIRCKRNEAIVLCNLKDGENWIREFIEHYFAMGFKHIVFLDNCSSDKTVSIAKEYKNVTILQSGFRFKNFNCEFKQYLARRFGRGKWSLCADIDEFFDYPFSDDMSLSAFLEYLNKNRYNAAAAHMLDMFSGKSLLSNVPGRGISKNNRYYDISGLEKRKGFWCYPNIEFYFGGVQKILFGMNKLLLTKFPLIFFEGKIKPHLNAHMSYGLNPADVRCVLFHYRYLSSFPAKVACSVKGEVYWNNSEIYKKFKNFLDKKPNVNMRQETIGTSKYLKNTNQLVDDGFLEVSKRYMGWVKNAKSN
jgi:glycosyltransferase involved in cell wall biosynthesis